MNDPFPDHPAIEVLESYVSGELSEEDLAPVEEHLLVCEICRQTVSELDALGWLLPGAPEGASAAFVHVTEDGPVRLEIRCEAAGWTARFWGGDLEGQAVFPSAREAYAYLRRSFREMYPAHLCEPECGAAAQAANRP